MTQLDVKIAFEKDGKVLSLDKILPRKQCKNDIKLTPSYKRILTSIKVIGIVEPLLVFPNENLR